MHKYEGHDTSSEPSGVIAIVSDRFLLFSYMHDRAIPWGIRGVAQFNHPHPFRGILGSSNLVAKP